jgi:hypothetical protein
MFTVDVEYKDGRRTAPEFPSKAEAVAYAGRMAQDSAIAFSAVRGLDSKETFANVIRRIRAKYSDEKATRILARMQNGASEEDAIYATETYNK